MKIRLRLVLFLALGFTLLFTFYSQRGYYTQTFNADYWKDKYDQSPWQLPLSTRPVGDDGLYLYQGHAMIHGADPSLLSAEVPPLGKYLIGFFTVFLRYPALYGIFVGALTLFVFYFLCQRILKKYELVTFYHSSFRTRPTIYKSVASYHARQSLPFFHTFGFSSSYVYTQQQ